MGRQIEDIQALTLSRINILKSVVNYIEKPEFKVFYAKASDNDQKILEEYIFNGNIIALKAAYVAWYYQHFGSGSIRYLRTIAKKLNIAYYTSLTKDELIREIYRVTEIAKAIEFVSLDPIRQDVETST